MKNNLGRKTLHIDKTNYSPVATVKQEDNIFLELELYKNGVEFDITNQTVTLAAKRSDKVLIEQIDGFTINNNILGIDFKNNIIAKVGLVYLELTLKDSSGSMTTLDFYLKVNGKILGEDSINASDNIASLEKIQQDFINSSNALLETVTENENTRVDAEGTRKLNEEIRGRNETSRSNAETKRVEAENLRKTAETSRDEAEKTRAAADALRDEKIEKFGSQVTKIENESKTIFSNKLINLVKKINKGFYIANTNGKINPVENSDYSYVVIDVTENMKITSSVGVSNNFSYVADAKNNVIGKIEDYRLRESGYKYIMPVDASKLYMCSTSLTNDDDIVVLNSDIDIATKRYSFRDFPYDKLVQIQIPKLFIPDVGYLTDYCQRGIDYSNIKSVNRNYLKTIKDLVQGSQGSELIFKDNILDVKLLKQYGGVKTDKFDSISDSLKVIIKGVKNVEMLDINLRYYDSKGKVKNILTKSLNDEFSEVFTIDCSSLAVYNDAQNFDVLIISPNSSGNFKITKFEILEPDEIQKNEIYDDTFVGIVNNIQEKINGLDNEISKSKKNILTSPNGTKYILNVSNDGILNTISLIPNKIIIAGNSIVNGMNDKDGTTFGMCASSNKKDFFAHVKNYILSKNNKSSFTRLQIAPFEQAESLEEQNQVWSDLNSKFTRDTDLVILQIGDNVNNSTREEMFRTGFEAFLNNIQTNCPKARILLVGCWFDSANQTTNTMKEISNKLGIELVLINDLYTKENQGHEGQEITWSDGSTSVVNSKYITHPGDFGMKKIADRVINNLGF